MREHVPLMFSYPETQVTHNPVELSQVAHKADTLTHVLLIATCLSAQTTGFSTQFPKPSIVLSFCLQDKQYPVKLS